MMREKSKEAILCGGKAARSLAEYNNDFFFIAARRKGMAQYRDTKVDGLWRKEGERCVSMYRYRYSYSVKAGGSYFKGRCIE